MASGREQTMKIGNPRVLAASVMVLGALSLGGCATKGFVRNEVGVVDQKLQATDAQVAAANGTIQQHGTQLAEIDKTSKEALDRANAANTLAQGKFGFTTVLTDDSVKFPQGSAALSTEAQTRLQTLAEKLKSDNRNVYLEIQGHIDPSERNSALGQARAEAVRRFLNQQGVALNRMGSISYGKADPVADSKTRTGRAQNRRVVVVVLS